MRHLIRLPVPVRVVEQKDQIGTAHALLCAKHLITDEVLVLPGDNYIDPASLKETLKVQNSMLITTHRHPSNFGVVEVDDGYITSIVEKPVHANRMTVSCGVYHLSGLLLGKITEQSLSEAITSFIASGERITPVYAHEWQDAIYPWDLICMNERLLRDTPPSREGVISGSAIIEGRVSIGHGSIIAPFSTIRGPAVIGEDCTIGPHVVILPGTSIGSRVTIEPFTVIGNSLIMDDCRIASHSTITSSVLGEACTLGDHTVVSSTAGFLDLGTNPVRSSCGVIMGNGVFSSPLVSYENSVIGNDCHIDGINGLKIRSMVIPDRTRVM
ncbi:MAG: nucleotidyl transferase [Methanomicrobiales archaeon HGW-Methanomicrobiales-4]|nr:MAG: nucleotidyl transferase [Methanomicrobiales archaeon HGW-Methanomicrobiales-4]